MRIASTATAVYVLGMGQLNLREEVILSAVAGVGEEATVATGNLYLGEGVILSRPNVTGIQAIYLY